MEFEDYQKEVFKDWRKRLFFSSFCAILILCVVYIAIFALFIVCGNFEKTGESVFWYVIQRIVIPLVICFASYLYTRIRCKKSSTESEKNYYALQAITAIAVIITIFNNYFVLVFAVPTISIIASLTFGDKKVILRNLFMIYIGLLIAFYTFSIDRVHRGQIQYIVSTIFITIVYYVGLSLFALSLSTIHKKTINIARESLMHREVLLKKLNLDSLTGLYNKGYLTQYLCSIIGKNNYYIAIMDLDNFKQVNDEYGHLSGDKILSRLAEIIDFQTKSDTYAFRFGGDEFVVVYKGKKTDFLASLNNVAREFATQSYDFAKNLEQTLSIGVTSILPDDTASSVFERCDKLMYKAKNTGKNRCVNDFE